MEYRLIHEKSIVVDAHNDVLSGAVARGHNISKRLDSGNTDLVRLKEGGVDVQVFAIFCDDSFGTGVAFTEAEKQADAFKMLINENSGKIVATRNLDEISHVVESGKIAAMLAIEGGHMLEDDISKLHKIAEWGVCYLTLTWNNSTSWASSAVDEFNATRNGKPFLSGDSLNSEEK
jgi:membrane dipeptidase